MASGLLLIVGWTLDIYRDSLGGAVLVLIGYVLAVFAFTGLYAVQRSRVGVLGLFGFVATVMASVLFVSFVFMDIARLSGVAPQVDWTVVESTGPTYVIGVIGGLGFVTFGVATFRAALLSRWPAVLLVVAGLIALIPAELLVGKLLPRVGGLALIGLGWSLWSVDLGRDSLGGAVLVLIGYVLAVFAFTGLYAVQRSRVGVLGLFGFVATVMASVLFVSFVFMDIARLSGVAPQVDWTVVESTGPTYVIGVIGGLGFVTFGVATFRAALLSRWPAVLLVVAGLIALIPAELLVGKLLPRVGGLALIGLGWSLWSVAADPTSPQGRE